MVSLQVTNGFTLLLIRSVKISGLDNNDTVLNG